MSRFAAFLVGCGDEGFEFEDDRFGGIDDITDHLTRLQRPSWIYLGSLCVFSQNIIAIEEEA